MCRSIAKSCFILRFYCLLFADFVVKFRLNDNVSIVMDDILLPTINSIAAFTEYQPNTKCTVYYNEESQMAKLAPKWKRKWKENLLQLRAMMWIKVTDCEWCATFTFEISMHPPTTSTNLMKMMTIILEWRVTSDNSHYTWQTMHDSSHSNAFFQTDKLTHWMLKHFRDSLRYFIREFNYTLHDRNC